MWLTPANLFGPAFNWARQACRSCWLACYRTKALMRLSWPASAMGRHAAEYLREQRRAREEDRWERGPLHPFTLAVIIAALLAAADMAEAKREASLAAQWRETADNWNGCIEGWLYVTGTELAVSALESKAIMCGFDSRYRGTGHAGPSQRSPSGGCTRQQRHPGNRDCQRRCTGSGPLRPGAHRMIRDSQHDQGHRCTLEGRDPVRPYLASVLMATNMEEPGWFSISRSWQGGNRACFRPSLTGERAHYELAAGRQDEAESG